MTNYVSVPATYLEILKKAALDSECYFSDPKKGKEKGYDRDARESAFKAADLIREAKKEGFWGIISEQQGGEDTTLESGLTKREAETMLSHYLNSGFDAYLVAESQL